MSEEDIQTLRQCYEDVIWMAIRYADGRHTYSPGMVRESVRNFKRIFPDFKLREDITLTKPEDIETNTIASRSDYLYDLIERVNNE
jgi:hypothetical protein